MSNKSGDIFIDIYLSTISDKVIQPYTSSDLVLLSR
jgi:hypothetical protein